MEDFRLLVLLIIFVASISSRYIVLFFKIYSSSHRYCNFEKKNKLAVQVHGNYVRLCSPLGAFGAV